MRYFVILFLIAAGVLLYLWYNPSVAQSWGISAFSSNTPPSAATTNATLGGTNAPPANDGEFEPPAPPPPPPVTTAEVISPNSSNFINPDHVKDVEQPPQHYPMPPATNAVPTPATNADGSTNAP